MHLGLFSIVVWPKEAFESENCPENQKSTFKVKSRKRKNSGKEIVQAQHGGGKGNVAVL